MQIKRNNRGFSLAELLIVAAILVVLAAVAFVAVQSHQRSMTQLEYDTIAKEIFVAAQNHLTAAESQGYPGLSSEIKDRETKNEYGMNEYGIQDIQFSENKDKVYYFVYPNPEAAADMLELMLPFGAIDETIRAGGSYLIRYQPSSARVLDVFYSNEGHTAWLTTKGTELSSNAFGDLMNNCRKTGAKEYKGGVVGWYGDGDALPVGTRLEPPQMLIHNEETLWIEVKDKNSSSTTGSLVLIITGETSGAKKAFYLRNGTTSTNGNRISGLNVVLDDITQEGFHFGEIAAESSSTPFIPGENITVEAVAYNNSELTNIAYSGKGRTNSIFADPSSYNQTGDTLTYTNPSVNGTVVNAAGGIAAVANFRHLENLDRIVSNWGGDNKKIVFTSAIQLTNLSDGTSDNQEGKLSWKSFVDSDKTDKVICTIGSTVQKTENEQYLPVDLETNFNYDGRNHTISKVSTDGKLSNTNRNAGIFGTLNGGTISNLLVLDSTISSSENAGGLIGKMSGTVVEKCAANGTVSSSGTAGGLIGTATSGRVTACYSGGHTDGTYASYYTGGSVTYGTDGKPIYGIYNIKATGTSGTAGGLIGDAGSTTIEYSYSTCSAEGYTAGGLVGNAAGTINNSYATGLVSGTTEGAFAGSFSGTATDCHYYEIINERKNDKEAFIYLVPVQGKETFEGITALDASAQTYNDFSLPKDKDAAYKWQPAVPNDAALKTYYVVDGDSVYNLRTVAQLGATLDKDTEGNVISIVATHYGDWPAPEIFVINQ